MGWQKRTWSGGQGVVTNQVWSWRPRPRLARGGPGDTASQGEPKKLSDWEKFKYVAGGAADGALGYSALGQAIGWNKMSSREKAFVVGGALFIIATLKFPDVDPQPWGNSRGDEGSDPAGADLGFPDVDPHAGGSGSINKAQWAGMKSAFEAQKSGQWVHGFEEDSSGRSGGSGGTPDPEDLVALLGMQLGEWVWAPRDWRQVPLTANSGLNHGI